MKQYNDYYGLTLLAHLHEAKPAPLAGDSAPRQ